MAFLKAKDNAESTLAQAIEAGGTSLIVVSGGERFPVDNFHISIDDEILLCTSGAGYYLIGGRIYDSVVGGQSNIAGSGSVFQYLGQNECVELFLYHSHISPLYTAGYPKTDALAVVRIA